MATGEEILRLAATQVGYHEDKDGRNKYGAWYASTFGPPQPMWNGLPWCMEFVQWVYAQAGSPLPYKTASCGDLLWWYRQHDPACVVKNPVPGCIVIFDFPNTAYSTDHTGLFVKVENGEITTIDGNTSNTSDASGGWVQQRTRKLSYANPTYIVPRELNGKEPEQMDEPRYNTIKEISDACPWATETVAKLIKHGTIRGYGVKDSQGRPADMDLSEDMLRVLVYNDRENCYGVI